MADLGPWEPLMPAEVQGLLAGAGFRWWIAGGWCLDLAVGRQTRHHADTDVSILRPDAAGFRRHVALWDVHVADPPGRGSLHPWPAGSELEDHVHDVWCRRGEDEPWGLQVMVEEVEGDDWVYRRDRRIRRPVASLRGRASVPAMAALAPEIQLLYKSTSLRDKDRADFERAAPLLSEDERGWLERALAMSAPDHPWLSRLGRTGAGS
jgi:hypothetical protein